MIALIKTAQVLLALSVLILVHELGHFSFSKLFGIRVDKFFLFFDAGGTKLLSTKTGWFAKLFPKAKEWETEYGIGWLPLGGYCKIAGMVDESMDTEYLKNEPQPWEFRTKPAWQRLLVMAGGVMFNFILNSPGMFDLAYPFKVRSVAEESANKEAGLLEGDRLIAIDGQEIPFIQDSWSVLKEKAGRTISADLLRGSDTVSMNLQVDTLGRLGIYLETPEVNTRDYSFITAIPAGFRKTFSQIGGYLKDLKLVATPSTEAYKSVGSFIAIGQVFPSAWDWHSFLSIIAMLSIMLAVMNLLPIPALDGGHIVFTLYEMITGRKPSDKFLFVTQMIGMILIFGLMFLAFGNDIARLLR